MIKIIEIPCIFYLRYSYIQVQKSVVDFSSKHLRGDSNPFCLNPLCLEIIFILRTTAIKFIIQNKVKLLKIVILVESTSPWQEDFKCTAGANTLYLVVYVNIPIECQDSYIIPMGVCNLFRILFRTAVSVFLHFVILLSFLVFDILIVIKFSRQFINRIFCCFS
jgi:hypothetical protein